MGDFQHLTCDDQNSSIFSHDLLTINWTSTNVQGVLIKRQKLTYLTMDMLPPYPLRYLVLKYNLITRVYLKPSLSQQQKTPSLHNNLWIVHLNLAYNPISQFIISDEIGVGHMDLVNCGIKSLNPQKFYFSKHILRANFHCNEIKVVSDENTTQSFGNLKYVGMWDNELSYVNFNYLPFYLNLAGNCITFFRTNSSNLHELDITYNRISDTNFNSNKFSIPQTVRNLNLGRGNFIASDNTLLNSLV